jgi:hypothetical protein
LDVPAVFSEMHGDLIRTPGLAEARGLEEIRIGSAPELSQGGNVIDIDAKENGA